MRYKPDVGKGLRYSTGRIIALGRLMLAVLFLLAIWVDVSQPAQAPEATYAILAAYVVFAMAIAALTWNDWWLDARLAGPAHAVDILLFTLLMLLTEGYTSPFFVFFMFVLLSPAIRWGWHATALTAILVTLLYLIAGILVARSGAEFELQRFIVRIGHLIILSLILIWFGSTRWRARFDLSDEVLLTPSPAESPLETGLRAAIRGVRAEFGLLIWRKEGGQTSGLMIRNGELSDLAISNSAVGPGLSPTAFLYDLRRDRALRKDDQRNLIDFGPSDSIPAATAAQLRLYEGLAIPLGSGDGGGLLLLEEVPSLSTDHIDAGERIAAAIAAHLQRHALLKAAEESAESRSRLTLARDLHDSVVQFLAGAAFRLEAMKRSQAAGRDLESDLNELKQLMLVEQQELRSFITALRRGSQVAFADLADDLEDLARRLSRQWDVQCEFTARPAETAVPARLHLDAHQLMREAVANAVRHAGAKSINVTLGVEPDGLQLNIVNDGSAGSRRSEKPEMPVSLSERVEQAGGTIDISRGMGVTKVAIALPVSGRNR